MPAKLQLDGSALQLEGTIAELLSVGSERESSVSAADNEGGVLGAGNAGGELTAATVVEVLVLDNAEMVLILSRFEAAEEGSPELTERL